MSDYRYIYLGLKSERRFAAMGWAVVDRSEQRCNPVRLTDNGRFVASSDPAVGTCVVSTKQGTALVEFADGSRSTVSRRRLRLKVEYERKQ